MLIDVITNNKSLFIVAGYDILRLIIMQLIAQASFSMLHSNVSFLNPVFIQTIVFLTLGLIIFWFFIYKSNIMEHIESILKENIKKDIKDRENK